MANGLLDGLNSTMGLLTVETLGGVARKKLDTTRDLREELSGKAHQVSAIIDEMRGTIKDHAMTELNSHGCLLGSEDEYLSSF